MTYPQPRYEGSGGEHTAHYRPADHEPDLRYPGGTTVHYLATGASTDGDFGLYRWDMGPEPGGPGPHFHRTISESFFILSGMVAIFDGEEWLKATPGDFVHVPPGGVHGFRNESGQPASMLLLFSPGAPREAYFEGLLSLAGATGAELAAFFAAHDNHWV